MYIVARIIAHFRSRILSSVNFPLSRRAYPRITIKNPTTRTTVNHDFDRLNREILRRA